MSQISSYKTLDSFYGSVNKKNNLFKDVKNRISGDGDIMELVDEKAVINKIITTLSIARGTYPFDPSVGCDLNRYIFDLASEINKRSIEDEVVTAVAPYKAFYKIEHTIKYMINKKGFVVQISLTTQKGDVIERKLMVDQNSSINNYMDEN